MKSGKVILRSPSVITEAPSGTTAPSHPPPPSVNVEAPIVTAPSTPLKPANFVGPHGMAHYCVDCYRKLPTGEIVSDGSIRYNAPVPFIVEDPPSPKEFEDEVIQVRDEANNIFVPIPPGYMVPSQSHVDSPGGYGSPDEFIPYESPPSGSDLEETRDITLRTRKRKHDLGCEHSDTER